MMFFPCPARLRKLAVLANYIVIHVEKQFQRDGDVLFRLSFRLAITGCDVSVTGIHFIVASSL